MWRLLFLMPLFPLLGQTNEAPCCRLPVTLNSGKSPAKISVVPEAAGSTAGMVKIPAGEFLMGSDDSDARSDEKPVHRVRLNGFWIDATEVTNAQFRRFVQSTGYSTTAEKAPVLADIMKQLPPGANPPAPKDLVAGSLVFETTLTAVDLNDPSQWWHWVKGANWKHPEGPESTIEGKDNYPVVQVSHDDAEAYAQWAHKRLPTEAEWEYSARGGLVQKRYAWGDEAPDAAGKWRANIWQGLFPVKDEAADGFGGLAPVKSFPANRYGLYDMAGNVWEWMADWYRPDTYAHDAKLALISIPQGPTDSFDPDQPNSAERVIRGGSFLCNACYCSGYRASARMKSTPDTSTNHIGFRCVKEVN